MSELVLIANAGDGTVSALRLHREGTEGARLEPLATSPVGPGVGTFAIDTDRDLVYAAVKGDPAAIVTLRLDRETGALSEISRRPVGASMTYLDLGWGGSVVLGASYGGGFGSTWLVDGGSPSGAGELGEVVARVEFANAHCILAAAPGSAAASDSVAAPGSDGAPGSAVAPGSEAGRGSDGATSGSVASSSGAEFAYLVSLGEDLVAQFSLGADGTLTPLDPPSAAAPAGSGPRHLVVEGRDAYVMAEFSGEAIRYAIGADGALARDEAVSAVEPGADLSHSRLGADPVEEHLIWGADLHVAGSWLLCSERSASTIASLPLDEGRLGDAVAFASTPKQPRGFGVTSDGAYVVAVGEKADVAALSRVESDGRLTPLGDTPIGAGANWVRIIA